MPANESAVIKECGDEDMEAGRGPGQLGWYSFATRFVHGKTVLDAGCGLAKGLDILKGAALEAQGQDLDPRLKRSDIVISDLKDLASKSFDVLTSIDVVEHVKDPHQYLADLARIARQGFFITTPNWSVSRCQWPYHLREYTPREFCELLSPFGKVLLFKGIENSKEFAAIPVEYRRLYFYFNDFRTIPAVGLAVRCFNRLLPRHCRIFGHNAAWVSLD